MRNYSQPIREIEFAGGDCPKNLDDSRHGMLRNEALDTHAADTLTVYGRIRTSADMLRFQDVPQPPLPASIGKSLRIGRIVFVDTGRKPTTSMGLWHSHYADSGNDWSPLTVVDVSAVFNK